MEVIYYTLIAAGLYLVSNWILDRIEVSRGARLEYRSIVFFFIILTLAIIAFGLINATMPPPAE